MIRVEAKNSARKRIKGLIVALVVVGGVALIPASSATAHVHGITPLLCVPSSDQPGTGTTGANQTDNTPANAVIGELTSSRMTPATLTVVSVMEGAIHRPVTNRA